MAATPQRAEAGEEVRPSLTIKRRFKASPEKIFAAWTDPEKIKQWWGPSSMTAFLAEVDPRIGGRFRVAMKGADDEVHDVSGIYKEFVPNEKLVMSWAWISTPERESQLTITVKADGTETILTLLHERFADVKARDDHHSGWTEALDKLVAVYS
tara:strand:- start:133713 stop:134174 length:462 start_codon:yes stop_codon:yes gene_type:complete